MTLGQTQFFVIGIIGILCITAIALGREKMIKAILWNYVVWLMCMTLGYILDIMAQWVLQQQLKNPTNTSFSTLYRFLTDSKMWIILFVYLSLLILIFTKSKLNATIDHIPLPKPIVTALLVMLTISWVILTLALSIWWADIIWGTLTSSIAATYFGTWWLTSFLAYTPVWILIHGVITLYLISDRNE